MRLPIFLFGIEVSKILLLTLFYSSIVVFVRNVIILIVCDFHVLHTALRNVRRIILYIRKEGIRLEENTGTDNGRIRLQNGVNRVDDVYFSDVLVVRNNTVYNLAL